MMKSSKPSNNKRQRRLNAWEEAKQYIHKNGGFIHEGIQFSSSLSSSGGHDEDDDKEHHVKVIQSSSSNIQKGDTIMRIPTDLLITLSTAEKSSFGPALFRLVDGIDNLYHSKNDILLALYLSFVGSRSNSGSDSKDNNGNEDENLINLYLATLPDNQSYNNLPRRWDNGKITKYLTGTSVIHRIQNEKLGLANDYKILKEKAMLMEAKRSNDELSLLPFPIFDIFDQMIAAVSSRAFDSLGDDQLEAMIILLDLFNHKRGVSSKTTSDISYARSEQVAEAEDRGDNSSSIIVTAKRHLETGSVPGITYGAKGNSQLLLRYGFTLDNNVEPDGSSNDIVEFYPTKLNGEMVELKRGPKAYTYGCFVKTLEMYLNTSDDANNAEDHNTNQNHDSRFGNDTDDMEDFLNSCEDQQGEDDMFGGSVDDGQFAMGLYNDDNDKFGRQEGGVSDDITPEIEAIDKFIVAIQHAREGYTFSGNELLEALRDKTSSCEYFCAVLIISEMKTFDLYELASMLVRRRLEELKSSSDHNRDDNDSEKFKGGLEAKYGSEEGQKVTAFAIELADTYYKIRHEVNL